MTQYTVGWYNPKLLKITNIEAWEDHEFYIPLTAAALVQRYQSGDGKRVFPSCIWVAFDLFGTLRIFALNQQLPAQRDLEHIAALVADIRNGGGFEREF